MSKRSRALKSPSTAEQLTFFAEDSPASRFPAPLPGSDEARTVTITSGQKCLELYRKSGRIGCWLKTLLTLTEWHSATWFLIWKASATKSRRCLKFRLVPSDTITGARASGFVATPTATANQDCPSMQKWPSCQKAIVTPKQWEELMGFPADWTDLD